MRLHIDYHALLFQQREQAVIADCLGIVCREIIETWRAGISSYRAGCAKFRRWHGLFKGSGDPASSDEHTPDLSLADQIQEGAVGDVCAYWVSRPEYPDIESNKQEQNYPPST